MATARSLWTDARLADRFSSQDSRISGVEDRTDALAGMPAEVHDLLREHRRDVDGCLREHRQEIRQQIRELPRPLSFWRTVAAIAMTLSPLYAILAAALLT